VNTYRDDAIVLRAQTLGHTDRVVTLLTRRSGRVRAAAKGMSRHKSRLRAFLDPFTHVELLMYPARSMDVITDVNLVRWYGEELAADTERSGMAAVMLEMAEQLTPVLKVPATDQFLLLIGGLRMLADGEHDPRLVLDAYLLRSLAVAGWGLPLEDCEDCSVLSEDTYYPCPRILCDCDPAPVPGLGMQSLQTVALMRALVEGDWETADASRPEHRAECSDLVLAYLQWHLEQPVSSLSELPSRSSGEHGRTK
jgi:DNA repair protein RecO (recombination protein O)